MADIKNMNHGKIINIINDLIYYQSHNHGISLDDDSRLIKDCERAIEYLRWVDKVNRKFTNKD